MNKKLVDIDKLFDDFLTEYITKNRGKYSEKDWESKIPELYTEFGKTELAELDGHTPLNFYDGLTAKELCDILNEHIENEIPASDFLLQKIVDSDCEKEISRFIDNEHDEELVSYCVNVLNDKNSTIAFGKYFDMLLSDETCEDMKDLLAEMLANNPEAAKEQALAVYDKAGSSKVYLLEIFASCKPDDRIFNILIAELMSHKKDIPFYLSYVTKYGDENALPYLLELIEDDGINYVDFKELKLAIEAFGGEYNKNRDFSNDKYYKKLKAPENNIKKPII